MDTSNQLGRYELVRLLGRGGMGEVHEAVLHGPSGFRKRVALKTVRTGRRSDATSDALVREARLGALLAHPNVVATWELGETDEGWFVAMELVRGPSLSDLRKRGPLSAGALVDVGVQACAGLHHVHDLRVDGQPAGLVHRDVKPANLLVDRSGLVKLADLGIAALATQIGTGLHGTAGFIAPEQLDGHTGPQSDLFALGVVLLWAATGRQPFGKGERALIAVRRAPAILRREKLIVLVDQHVPGLGSVIERCLQPDPSLRWRTAGELGSALRALRVSCPPGQSLADILAERFPEYAQGGQVAAVGSTPAGPTQWTPPPLPPSNLPELSQTIVGRHNELQLTIDALSESRVVTLRGTAGVGKSRLALEVGRRRRKEFAGGVWWVELEEVRSRAGLSAEVARSLGVPVTQGEPEERIGAALAGRGPTLLILDGPERCLDAVEESVPRWVGRAPELKVLIASRRRVRVNGREVGVEPLSERDTMALLKRLGGAALAATDARDLRKLAQALEGLPLAVELAAARAAFLPVPQLLMRLEDRFRLLSSTGRGKHATLRTALDAAWEDLSVLQRNALAQLSVFAGGWKLDHAEAVLHLGDADAPWALDLLQQLVEHSLVRWDAEVRRFRMLTTVREYAQEHLADPDARAARVRHGEVFSRVASLADPHREGPVGPDDGAILARERENFVVALRAAIDRGDIDVAFPVCLALVRVLQTAGPLAPAMLFLDEMLAMDLPRDLRVRLVSCRSTVLMTYGELDRAEADLRQALADMGPDGPEEIRVSLMVDLGNALRQLGRRREAQRCLEIAVADSERLGRPRLVSRAVADLGILHRLAGRLDEAEACNERALVINRELRLLRREATVLNNLANVKAQKGEVDEAIECLEASLEISRRTGDRPMVAVARLNLAAEAQRRGDLSVAIQHTRRAARGYRRMGAMPGWIFSKGNLSWQLMEMGELDEATDHAKGAVALAEERGLRPYATVSMAALARLAHLRGDQAAALATATEALELERGSGDERSEATMELLVGLLHRTAGDVERAEACVRKSLEWAEERDDRLIRGQALHELAEVACANGQTGEAVRLAAEALDLLSPGGVGLDGLYAQLSLCRALFADGNRVRAAEVLHAADEEITHIGMGPLAPLRAMAARVRAML